MVAASGAEAEPVRAVSVQGSVAMITGEGGNIGALTGSQGTLLVDARFARRGAGIVPHTRVRKRLAEGSRIPAFQR
ncbi:hypothetical protein VB734_05415 [Synechococcus sp. BA-124 BA4]|uniref:hypothetical protein n=1 Tax=Synechococcus sp. CBW1107 TaxID=2789857 RepID=UPI0018CF903D|nr:hypothetical protein [Synechococcus sp. CBW1107]MEA5399477.1 hypothetical protein [Synechococcus sp. BA-124 BA4]QPN55424.1 hypothetical protein I1E95_09290 [Synechococcus sp. CBW1107]